MKHETPTYEDSLAESIISQRQITPLDSPVQRIAFLYQSDDVPSFQSTPILEEIPQAEHFGHALSENLYTPQSEDETLPLEEARCHFLPNRSAAWLSKSIKVPLSTLAATILIKENIITSKDLLPYKHTTTLSPGPSDPLSGILHATHSTVGGIIQGVVDYPLAISQMIKEDRPVATSLATNFALDSDKGVSRIIGTGLKAPMEFTLGMSRGFHNLPKVYGDEVRQEEEVTGLWSGTKAGVKGLGLGLYDGIGGLVMQPMNGVKRGGLLGGLKGFGRGIGGLVCKPAAGAIGLPAQTFRGVYEQGRRWGGLDNSSADGYTVATLLTQGEEEWKLGNEHERRCVVGGWYEAREEAMKRGGFKYQ